MATNNVTKEIEDALMKATGSSAASKSDKSSVK